ncbi:MAG: hypothetical protein HC844_04175 [Tabrizicola sp.]|nr:hypothetical protein [Tabrizicola sp.]
MAAEAIGPRPQTDVLLEVTPTLRRPESAANPPPPVATPGQSSPLQADGFAPLARPEGRAPVPPIPADATAAPAERPATWPDQTVSRPLPPGIGQDVAAAKLPDPPAGQGPVPASSAATEGAGKAPRAEAPEPARATALPEGAREAASPAEKPAPGPAVPLIGAETAEPAATEVDEGESAPDRPVPKQEQAAVPSAAPLGRSVAVYRIEAASVLMNGDSELIMEAGGMTEFAPTGTITHWPSSLSGAAAAPVSAAAPTAALSAPMIQVLSGPRDGVTEIALSPEELGHVRLTFRKAPADPERLVLMVAFERPESLDLFRRNADQLLSDIRAAGYAGVDLSFSHWGGEGRNPSSPPQSQTPGTAWQADETATNIAQPPRLLLPSSLDLRL